MKQIFMLVMMIAFSHQSLAAAFKTEAAALSAIETSMQKISEGKLFDAINSLVEYTITPAIHTKGTIKKLVEGRKKYDSKFGESLGYELVKTQRIGNDVVKYLYLEKTKNHLLKWTYTIYNSNGNWKVLTYKWDDEINELFQ